MNRNIVSSVKESAMTIRKELRHLCKVDAGAACSLLLESVEYQTEATMNVDDMVSLFEVAHLLIWAEAKKSKKNGKSFLVALDLAKQAKAKTIRVANSW